MIATILEAILAFLKAIPYFDKWFTKTTQERIEAGHKALDKEQEEVRRTGRPPA